MLRRLCSAVIPVQRHAIYLNKAYVFGQIKAMSVYSYITERAFRHIATPLCSEIISCWVHFYGEICQRMFSPLRFSYLCGAHEYIMTSLYPVHQWRQTGDRGGRRGDYMFAIEIVSRFSTWTCAPKTSRKCTEDRWFFSLCRAHNLHLHFFTARPTYPSQNGEMNFFSQAIRKRAGTCQIKYATGCV